MTMTEPALHPVQSVSRGFAAAGIATEDWDLLFRAALDMLARMAFEKAAPESPGVRLQAHGTALRECMDALDQLRRSARPPGVRQSRLSARTEVEAPPGVAAPAQDP